MNATADLLRKAAVVMEQRGMAKNVYIVKGDFGRGVPGSVCLQGALQIADGIPVDQVGQSSHGAGSINYVNALKEMAKVIKPYSWTAFSLSNVVGGWNNEDDTTPEMAVAKLREVADLIDA